MKASATRTVFRWAKLQDMKGADYLKTFRTLEDCQSRFLSAKSGVNGDGYKWTLATGNL